MDLGIYCGQFACAIIHVHKVHLLQVGVDGGTFTLVLAQEISFIFKNKKLNLTRVLIDRMKTINLLPLELDIGHSMCQLGQVSIFTNTKLGPLLSLNGPHLLVFKKG